MKRHEKEYEDGTFIEMSFMNDGSVWLIKDWNRVILEKQHVELIFKWMREEGVGDE